MTIQLTPVQGSDLPSKKNSPRRKRSAGMHPAIYLFPLPAIALYAVFYVMPTLQSVQYAITDWDGFSPDYEMVGLGNFRMLSTADDLFTNAFVNNVKLVLTVVICQTIVALVLALLLQRNSRSTTLLRALYFFPTILSGVSVAFIWKFIYDPNFGPLNSALRAVGLDNLQSAWLGDESIAIYLLALTMVWFHAGQMMIIFIAGLQSVPTELLESAEIDGASRWQKFRYVTWPLLAPATAIVVSYTTIASFKAFDLVLGMGGNPPKPSMDVLPTRIYASFANSQLGYAAAESIVLVLIIGVVTLLQRRVLSRSRV